MPNTRLVGPRSALAWALPVAAGVVVVAGSIAAWLMLGNAGTANECPVQAAAAQIIDAAAVGELAALNGTGEGRGYSDMAFKDAAGTQMSVADFAGKALLVNFWASWCVPCREEMPALDAIATEFNSEKFMVLPINLDIGASGLEKAQAFLDEGQFANLPLFADNTFAAFERLKREAVAIGLPATLLLDPEGCELAVLQGPAEWHSDDGRAVIEALIGLRG
ncbi:TlpA family protein disulfide reductase [Devosia sp. XJ19-1]|uniref:TlpA family protein disulfide reductase n=1 Tax=Devosia ureilytica TaxID=2952754 RepID=A0A9Q4ANU4_9HYPH|nr:TlpA disulfide reductase family protein [Devosia ureilytica]MCP8882636.1 TlpA family protein disulfide reductase [Devosia ureilytica]MCP8886996.1 TlpA family protein disulfide reductase [Devosia ureilytica]